MRTGLSTPRRSRPIIGWRTDAAAPSCPVIEEGHNVDFVPLEPSQWSELATESFDVVLSDSTSGHIASIWITAAEIARVLRPGGLAQRPPTVARDELTRRADPQTAGTDQIPRSSSLG